MAVQNVRAGSHANQKQRDEKSASQQFLPMSGALSH
jgi:hypothetical protein